MARKKMSEKTASMFFPASAEKQAAATVNIFFDWKKQPAAIYKKKRR